MIEEGSLLNWEFRPEESSHPAGTKEIQQSDRSEIRLYWN